MKENGDKAIFDFKIHREAIRVNCEDIVFFESYGHYVSVHMKDKNTYTFRATLHDIDNRLKDKGFVRVHRGFLINLDCAGRITRDEVYLGAEWGSVPLSRKYKARVYKVLKV